MALLANSMIMAPITFIHLSAVLGIASGNGFQLIVRGRFELDHQWLAAELLVRAKQRWPLIDDSGFKPSIGPAIPNTKKCKGIATEDAPHRMVAVEWATPGDYWCTPDDLVALIQSLPAAATSAKRAVKRVDPVVLTEWQAVSALDIRDTLVRMFGRECCPVCKSDDSAFAILSECVCVCLHARRCPAAASGHRGFTSAHAYGYKLFDKWTGFTAASAQRSCVRRATTGTRSPSTQNSRGSDSRRRQRRSPPGMSSWRAERPSPRRIGASARVGAGS